VKDYEETFHGLNVREYMGTELIKRTKQEISFLGIEFSREMK